MAIPIPVTVKTYCKRVSEWYHVGKSYTVSLFLECISLFSFLQVKLKKMARPINKMNEAIRGKQYEYSSTCLVIGVK